MYPVRKAYILKCTDNPDLFPADLNTISPVCFEKMYANIKYNSPGFRLTEVLFILFSTNYYFNFTIAPMVFILSHLLPVTDKYLKYCMWGSFWIYLSIEMITKPHNLAGKATLAVTVLLIIVVAFRQVRRYFKDW